MSLDSRPCIKQLLIYVTPFLLDELGYQVTNLCHLIPSGNTTILAVHSGVSEEDLSKLTIPRSVFRANLKAYVNGSLNHILSVQ